MARKFLTTVLVALAVTLLGCRSSSNHPPRGGPSSGIAITHGPMLGRIGPKKVGVWVRTSKPGEFHVFYGTAPDRLLTSFPGETLEENDNTGFVEITTLDSNTKYYQVSTSATPEPDSPLTGHFQSKPGDICLS